ncbi:hypothetical protein AXG93_1939s1070 [Marchantia polymorpha subsp. ruderalis]|uniref:Uncharacterized protein n=1 Tax=Marchantia polymorpha subsp. ruderalis TaxID=1480154 RepID=A0A176VW69_MARPO|nr:hypothetical protein AXG93_1939s1070 [Marchantia polymorpha subsp. ruderalis]
MNDRTLDARLRIMRGQGWRLHFREGERESDASQRIYIRAALEESLVEYECTRTNSSESSHGGRGKVAEASGEGQRLEAPMAGTDITQLRTPQRSARPKKKANCRVVVSKSLKGSVAMIEAAASTTDDDTREKVNLWTTEARPLNVQNEDPLKKDVEPLGKRTAMSSQGLQPLERKKSSLERKQSSLEKNETL